MPANAVDITTDRQHQKSIYNRWQNALLLLLPCSADCLSLSWLLKQFYFHNCIHLVWMILNDCCRWFWMIVDDFGWLLWYNVETFYEAVSQCPECSDYTRTFWDRFIHIFLLLTILVQTILPSVCHNFVTQICDIQRLIKPRSFPAWAKLHRNHLKTIWCWCWCWWWRLWCWWCLWCWNSSRETKMQVKIQLQQYFVILGWTIHTSQKQKSWHSDSFDA